MRLVRLALERRFGRRSRYLWLVLGISALLAVVMLAFVSQPRLPSPRQVDWASVAAGPADKVRVYWVGHSLLNCRDEHVEGSTNILGTLGRFAQASGLGYDAFDHTLYGTHLSLLWSGAAHASERVEPELLERRQKLLREGSSFDALVLTEGIPILRALEQEHSAYYAQAFYCALVTRNPQARVYVSESWSHLYASDPDGDYPAASGYDWTARLKTDRKYWEQLADLAGTGAVPSPSRWARLGGLVHPGARACTPTLPIFLVPVGSVFVQLAERLEREAWPFSGRNLGVRDLFANPYEDWPKAWPLAEPLESKAEQRVISSLHKRYPNAELDDIHLSDLGVYVSSLVHYAVLYRRSPVGLPCAVRDVDPELARRIQELVWQAVRSEPRAGVRGAN